MGLSVTITEGWYQVARSKCVGSLPNVFQDVHGLAECQQLSSQLFLDCQRRSESLHPHTCQRFGTVHPYGLVRSGSGQCDEYERCQDDGDLADPTKAMAIS
jgi:hypothetical protein